MVPARKQRKKYQKKSKMTDSVSLFTSKSNTAYSSVYVLERG